MKTSINAALILSLGLAFLGVSTNADRYFSECRPDEGSNINSFFVRDVHNKSDVALSNYISGKVALVVNVASFCRLTEQYHQFNALLTEFRDNLTILGFPCDQFGHQEPGVNGTEILNSICHVRPGSGFQLHPEFHLMLRGAVNGPHGNPVFSYLKRACPQPESAYFKPRESFWDPIKPNDITWNFEKFLIDRTGRPLYRFCPDVEPFDVRALVRFLTNHTATLANRNSELLDIVDDIDENVQRRLKLKIK